MQFHVHGGVVSIVDGDRVILENIAVSLRLHDGRNVALPFASFEEAAEDASVPSRLGARQIQRVVFAADEGRTYAKLELAAAGAGAALFVRAHVHNRELFRDRVTLASEAGVVVHVGNAPGLTSLMANYQHKDWWTRPHVDPNLAALPPRTLSLLWRAGEAGYAQLLPMTDDAFRADLCGSPSGGFDVRLSAFQGGFASVSTAAFALAAGDDPYALADETAALGLAARDALAKPRADKSYPEPLDYLGWCSWDAFYQKVDAEGLLTKTAELAAAGLPVRWVMIDDGWSEISDDKRLRTYDADRRKFPGGLAPVVNEMKAKHGVRWVGVWHTIAGYWGGVDPDGELFEGNRGHLFETNGGVWVPAPDAAKAFGFWNDWHGYLKRQGIDFVKVDSQSAVLNFFRELAPIGAAAKAAHTALEASVALHFGGTIINCMGMASENVWHRPMSAVSRNSDDFVPEEATGFREHALQNAYNSYFHGSFYWGDWDMFWSTNHDAVQNMALRAVSGGPVYVSDKVGGTNPDHIWPLVYRDGRIIRCDRPGVPTADCLMVDPVAAGTPLKLWNTVGASGVVAAFGLSESAAEGSTGPSDVPGLAGDAFVAYEYFSGKATRLAADERLPLRLAPAETAMYAYVPERAGGVTPIGLVNKLVPQAAIERVVAADSRLSVSLREGGRFGFAASGDAFAAPRATVNGRVAAVVGRDGWHEIDCSGEAGPVVIDIDIEGATSI
ncbi:Sip1-related alpha-galactosidase [Paenibacillus sp.]|uniref:Sip1-related alpha-galactosidase n=1 Tax=Paenibacillus sp. TaxID=58172 RepID=UPI002D65DFCB|nr:Sip1-related alpha-galactosidase [Paenibacillus sp.]HZG57134.1 Sip1-related alpha-galactosidase [Paenibacillus sp.]